MHFLLPVSLSLQAALAVLMATWAKQVNISSECVDELAQRCPRGQGKPCLDCVARLKAAGTTPASCGEGALRSYDEHFFCGEVRQLRHHFGPSLRVVWALYHPTHAVYCALLGYHAYWMLIGACDPML